MVRVLQYGPRRHGGGGLWRCHGRRRGRRRVRSPVYSSGQVFAQAGSVVDFFCLEFFKEQFGVSLNFVPLDYCEALAEW